VAELIDGGYRLTAQQLVALSPVALLDWLCRPELMRRWMPGVERVDVVEGDPSAPGCRTKVSLGLYTPFGGGEWKLAGRIEEIGPARLVRTYEQDKYLRTVAYDMAPNDVGALLNCEVQTVIPGLPPSAARAGAKAEEKSLRQSLEVLARLSGGQRVSRLRGVFKGRVAPQAL
jgi:hypothetical protein